MIRQTDRQTDWKKKQLHQFQKNWDSVHQQQTAVQNPKPNNCEIKLYWDYCINNNLWHKTLNPEPNNCEIKVLLSTQYTTNTTPNLSLEHDHLSKNLKLI